MLKHKNMMHDYNLQYIAIWKSEWMFTYHATFGRQADGNAQAHEIVNSDNIDNKNTG